MKGASIEGGYEEVSSSFKSRCLMYVGSIFEILVFARVRHKHAYELRPPLLAHRDVLLLDTFNARDCSHWLVFERAAKWLCNVTPFEMFNAEPGASLSASGGTRRCRQKIDNYRQRDSELRRGFGEVQ